MKLSHQLFTLCPVFFLNTLAFAGSEQKCTSTEKHRIEIENSFEGLIRGSRDGGASWEVLGTIKIPVQGEYWIPGVNNGVLAFNYLRGESSVFASAVNNLHIRFSDPEGYSLPKDVNVPPVDAHGLTFAPVEELKNDVPKRVAVTSMPGGSGLFGPHWSPRIGDKVFVGNGAKYATIPYEFFLRPTDANNRVLIVTQQSDCDIEYIEFENKSEGKVFLKESQRNAVAVAKVKQAVEGIGRFVGSEYISQPGVIRANHAGVFDIGTTDVNIDSTIPPGSDINELRGGFQVVPSHHYADSSMNSGGAHGFVYMVVGPLIDPPHLKRYDMGVEAQYPLFFQGMRAGKGRTMLRFSHSKEWIEMNDAISKGHFRSSGKPVYHLRGVLRDVMKNVTHIRIYNENPPDLPVSLSQHSEYRETR